MGDFERRCFGALSPAATEAATPCSEKNVGVQLTLSPWKLGGAAAAEHHIKSNM